MPSRLLSDLDDGFGLHNLPYGAFSRPGFRGARLGVRVGDAVLDLPALVETAALPGLGPTVRAALKGETLNPFMALGPAAWAAVRTGLQDRLRSDEALPDRAVVPLADAALHLPVAVGDYTDFYSSRQHATNVGVMFRGPENALMPNWLHMPIGYHGRASTVVVSGTPVRRPSGQTRPDDAAPPVFGPSRQLDFELELGVLTGPGNALGDPITVSDAPGHIFGYVLVNDWSARDLQKWEYVPLGPFLGKNFATSVSPWVVPAAALEPFRVEGEPQDPAHGNPEPLPYLRQAGPRALDIGLDVTLQSAAMRAAGVAPACIARSNARHLYWSPEQQLAHHTVGGCAMRPGDLFASGTISGDSPDSYGSMLELAWRGTRPIVLPTGETRAFLADGDRLCLRGLAERDGRRVSFGKVEGKVLPALG